MLMVCAEAQVRVRYAETDRMGYVYYGNYATYYEVARRQLMEKLGLSYVQLEADGYFLPIAKMESKYIRPAYYDDLLRIKVCLKQWESGRLVFEYEIFNSDGQLIHLGSTVQVFISAETRKPVRPPKYFLQAVEKALDKQRS